MNSFSELIETLHSIRNDFRKNISSEKTQLLEDIDPKLINRKNDFIKYFESLNFLVAYPDNPEVYDFAKKSSADLFETVCRKKFREKLYNSGIPGTKLNASFSFDIIHWLHRNYRNDISINAIEADDAVIQSILSVVLPKVESEIMQDANESWKTWLGKAAQGGEDLLAQLVSIFDQTEIRPEVRDELWSALGIDIEINLPTANLPESLVKPFYHNGLLRTDAEINKTRFKYEKLNLAVNDAAQIINSARMVLVQNFREIDPITFTAPEFVSYYKLQRGLSIALLGMVPERRHPIDSYMGYIVFKNDVPVAYAGSWMLFNSGRIGLNVFPSYRGGESFFIFKQILKLHESVYRLSRLSVDPYQIGKDNSDGIHSGAFYFWHRAGFRSMEKEQRVLAESENKIIRKNKEYRSSEAVLKKLSESRMELILKKDAVRFDVNDLSRVYLSIIQHTYSNDRKLATGICFNKISRLLRIRNSSEPAMNYIIRNWSVLLASGRKDLLENKQMIVTLKKLFELKAYGSEEEYIFLMQRSISLRLLLLDVLKENGLSYLK